MILPVFGSMVAPSERGKNWYQAAKLDFGRSTLKRWGWLGRCRRAAGESSQGGDGRVVAGGETIPRHSASDRAMVSAASQGLAIAWRQAGVRGFGPNGPATRHRELSALSTSSITRTFDAGVVQPGDVRVFPTFDGHGPFAELTLDGRVAILLGFRSSCARRT